MESILKSFRIVGSHSAVPATSHSFVETPEMYTPDEAQKIYETTGIHSRRILEKNLCISDLCIYAARSLLTKLNWDPKTVDVLIFVTQGPDYTLPSTACLMQSFLGLPQSAACMDVTLGCSGFTYGLWLAHQLLQGSNGKRALVLCGDTASRNLQKNTAPLFGDAGTATALEISPDWPDSYGVFGTDGTGGVHISVEYGGARNAVRLDEIKEVDELLATIESINEKSRLHLNGGAVFTFTLKIVPPLLRDTLKLAQIQQNEVDMFVMHQANKFILEHLRKKMGVPEDKYIIDMERFGNTSSASIPLAMCHKLSEFYTGTPKKTMMAGFGVGWSWGTILSDVKPLVPFELVEMPHDVAPLPLKQ